LQENSVPYYINEIGQHYNTFHTGSFSDLMNVLHGSEIEYYKPYKNYKKYYQDIVFFQSVINTIVDTLSTVEFKEVDSEGNEIENSDYVDLLEKPNKWTDKKGFVKEFAINELVNGSAVIWGNFFKNGNLKKTDRELYVLDNFNLYYPKIDSNFFSQPDFSIKNLIFKLHLDNQTIDIPYKDLIITYDTIKRGLYHENNTMYPYFNRDAFLTPISRVDALKYDLQIIKSTQDALAYFSTRPVGGILSKNNPSGVNIGEQLDAVQKAMQEKKINGKDDYGASLGTKGHIITTNEDLKFLSIYTDTPKIITSLIEMQNNAKQNTRTAYGIPPDILDARSGKTQGSTYENQSVAEARFVANICQPIIDNLCLALTLKSPEYFKTRGTKLIASFDHLPSVIKGKEKDRQEGIKFETDALKNILDANEKAISQGINLNINRYLKENGLESLL